MNKTIATMWQNRNLYGRRTASGFSVVEMLVVLVVLAVLAGLLFPVLSKSIRTVRTTKCAEHLRQLYVAVALFSNDNDGNYPTAMNAGTLWHQRLAPYLGIDLPNTEVGGAPPCEDTPFRCPSVYEEDEPRRSYAFNSRLVDAFPNADDRVVGVHGPSKAAMIADALHTSWLQSSSNISTRHDGGKAANVLFVDGHVEKMTAAELAARSYTEFIVGK